MKAFCFNYHLNPLSLSRGPSKGASSQALATQCLHAVYTWSQQKRVSSVRSKVPNTLPCTPCPAHPALQPNPLTSLKQFSPKLISAPPIARTNVCTLALNFLSPQSSKLESPSAYPQPSQILTEARRYSQHTLLSILKGILCFKARQVHGVWRT